MLSCTGNISPGLPNGDGVGPYDTSGDPADEPVDEPAQPRQCAPMLSAPAPLRRLTQEEFTNSVRDLLGQAVDVGALGSDEKVGPFSTNVAAPIARLGVEQYAAVSEKLANDAVKTLSTLLPCDPAQAGQLACAKQFIGDFGRRAYRRPLSTGEAARYEALYTAQLARADFTQAIRLVVQAVLQSPNFLYHIERVPSATNATSVSAYELAARLASFLWNSLPDVALLDAARDGSLSSPGGLEAQVDRMLASPKAKTMLGNFHLQLLGVNPHQKPEKVSATFPQFNDALWKAMVAETVNFSEHVVLRGDGKLSTLFAADYALLESALFPFYGIPEPSGHQPSQPVPTAAVKRTGLLTQGSYLATQAHSQGTSPVRRGVVVRRNLFCQALPDPPDDVNTQLPEPQPGQTTREVMTSLTSDPNSACITCHKLINPIGFAFEGFDAIGAQRTQDNGKDVDTTGTLSGLGVINGPFNDGFELSKKLGVSPDIEMCMTKQWFRFAVGRSETLNENCELYNLTLEFRANGSNVKWLLKRLATSAQFQRPPEKT